jgi:hypothetical protein
MTKATMLSSVQSWRNDDEPGQATKDDRERLLKSRYWEKRGTSTGTDWFV